MRLKPTKKQKAIIALLNAIEDEGLNTFAFSNTDTLLKNIGDEDLTQLVSNFDEAYNRLDTYLSKLEQQVQPFRNDEWDDLPGL